MRTYALLSLLLLSSPASARKKVGDRTAVLHGPLPGNSRLRRAGGPDPEHGLHQGRRQRQRDDAGGGRGRLKEQECDRVASERGSVAKDKSSLNGCSWGHTNREDHPRQLRRLEPGQHLRGMGGWAPSDFFGDDSRNHKRRRVLGLPLGRRACDLCPSLERPPIRKPPKDTHYIGESSTASPTHISPGPALARSSKTTLWPTGTTG